MTNLPERAAGQRIALEMGVIYERQSQRMRVLANVLRENPGDDCAGLLERQTEDVGTINRLSKAMFALFDPDIKSPAFETAAASGSAPVEARLLPCIDCREKHVLNQQGRCEPCAVKWVSVAEHQDV